MTPTTRSFCPLCDWHHDSTDPVPTVPAPGMSIAEHAEQALTAHYAVLEAIIREHLESHPLIEWAKKVALLQRNLADAEADVKLAMDEWGKSDQHHAEESVAMAAERGAWGTTRIRVWNAAQINLGEEGSAWQSGFRACSERVLAALDEPADMVLYDFNAAPLLPVPALDVEAADAARLVELLAEETRRAAVAGPATGSEEQQ